ncbi:MAG: polysaccharide deacetylase family protein [Xanthomonadaceae bacterium]|nr:polysaccharide deacetylase family protein [Xanthomonadaceae bacterium]MDE1965008.1 polysaccharide deacetylase family protein [Xanthomonadaceae bacterium]
MNIRPKKHQILALLPSSIVQTHGDRAGTGRFLSFDDGPHPEHTPRLLDLLAAHGVRASFFVVGRHAEQYPSIVERIVRDGHLLGNHSYSHTRFAHMSTADQVADLERADRLLAAFDGRARHRIRTPQGHVTLPLLLHLARSGRSLAYWCYDSMDYHDDDAAVVARRLQTQPPHAGDIVLMHDDGDSGMHALAEMLPAWCRDGWTFHALEQDAACE